MRLTAFCLFAATINYRKSIEKDTFSKIPCHHLMCIDSIWTAKILRQAKISQFQDALFIDQQVVWF